MKAIGTAFLFSFMFGLGLAISGMTLPAKILGFLDVGGQWDPTMFIVMASAVSVHAFMYWLIRKRSRPIFAAKFQIPTRRDIDWRLIVGSMLFGAGWGLSGFCPGPALVNLSTFEGSALAFVASMITGIYLYNFFNSQVLQKSPRAFHTRVKETSNLQT